MKQIKRNVGRDEEKWIGELLDRVDEEKLLEISAIHSDIPLPVPNQEKLAQSVIDKADLADEEELARRRAFAKAYRRKKIIHGCVAACAVLAVFTVLALCGVFDRIYLPRYEYTIEAAAVYNGAEVDDVPEFGRRVVTEFLGGSVGNADSLSDNTVPEVNEDKVDNTAYDVVADYCEKNHYAVDEHKVLQCWYYEENGKRTVMCEVLATFMKLDKSPDGKKTGEQADAGESAEEQERVPDALEDYLDVDLLDSTQGAAVFLLTLDV